MCAKVEYEFLGMPENLIQVSGNAMSAFCELKRRDQTTYYKFTRFSKGQLPPEGYSLLSIGYGLSIAYKVRER